MAREPIPIRIAPDPPDAENTGGGGGNGGGDFNTRLTRLETHFQYLATKEDMAEVKRLIVEKESSLQRWLIGIVLSAAGTTAIALIRLFSN